MEFSEFRVLLDDPAKDPALGWRGYAAALAATIEHSSPQFAVGIFGDWGSGKTTLMQAIWEELAEQEQVVQVWFNAWRYEREEHLIVPLLDTLRQALVDWAEAKPAGGPRDRVRSAAEKLGRAARALLAGLSLRARVPLPLLELEAGWDPSAAMAAFAADTARDDPASFYYASFQAMHDAVADFRAGGVSRVVVYVDDLDRCLPESALQVLESMKLFFDLEGFIFVVGLDQQVIERSVESKYNTARIEPSSTGNGSAVTAARIDGAAYIKKIFQVSLGLPRIEPSQIDEYFEKLVLTGDLPVLQQQNLNQHVRRHLPYLLGDEPVNPREVKRFLNAYTLQLKMLSSRGVVPLDPDIVLALQTLGFRRDWQSTYERLTTETEIAGPELREAAQARGAGTDTGGFPGELLDYLNDAAPTFLFEPLAPYISTARSVTESDPSLIDAQAQLARLRRRLAQLTAGDELQNVQSDLASVCSRLTEIFGRRTDRATARGALEDVQWLERAYRTIDPKADADQLNRWRDQVLNRTESIDDALRVLRRQTSVGAASTA